MITRTKHRIRSAPFILCVAVMMMLASHSLPAVKGESLPPDVYMVTDRAIPPTPAVQFCLRLEIQLFELPLTAWEDLKDTTVKRGRVGSLPVSRMKWLAEQLAKPSRDVTLLSSASTVVYADSTAEVCIGRIPVFVGGYARAAHGPLPSDERLLLGLMGRFRLVSLTAEDKTPEAMILCETALVQPAGSSSGERSDFLRTVTTPGGPLELPRVRGFHCASSIRLTDGENRILAAYSSPFGTETGTADGTRTALVVLKAVFPEKLDLSAAAFSLRRTSQKPSPPKKALDSYSPPENYSQYLDPADINQIEGKHQQANRLPAMPFSSFVPRSPAVLVSGKILRLPEGLVRYLLKRYVNSRGEIEERGRRLLGKAIKEGSGAIVDSFDISTHQNLFFHMIYGLEQSYLNRYDTYAFTSGDTRFTGLVPDVDSILSGTKISGFCPSSETSDLYMNLIHVPAVSFRETKHTWGPGSVLSVPAEPKRNQSDRDNSQPTRVFTVEQPDTTRMKMELRTPVQYGTSLFTQGLGVKLSDKGGQSKKSLETYVFLLRLTR